MDIPNVHVPVSRQQKQKRQLFLVLSMPSAESKLSITWAFPLTRMMIKQLRLSTRTHINRIL